jgi:hypothetical protein
VFGCTFESPDLMALFGPSVTKEMAVIPKNQSDRNNCPSGQYNGRHRRSATRYITPDERHFGRELEILVQHQRRYERARLTNAEQWTGATQNRTPGAVRDAQSSRRI